MRPTTVINKSKVGDSVVLHTDAATLPTPTGNGGGSIAALRDTDGFGPRDGSIKIKNTDDASVTLTSVQPFVKDNDEDWCGLGLANQGADIVLAAGEVARIPVYDLPALGTRVAVAATVAGTTPKITVTYESLYCYGG